MAVDAKSGLHEAYMPGSLHEQDRHLQHKSLYNCRQLLFYASGVLIQSDEAWTFVIATWQ